MFFKKKIQCVRCGKRRKDADLFVISGVHVCKKCISPIEAMIASIDICINVQKAAINAMEGVK